MQLPKKLMTEGLTMRKLRAEYKLGFIEFMTHKESTKYLEFSATQKYFINIPL
jgi:hypothetical protein